MTANAFVSRLSRRAELTAEELASLQGLLSPSRTYSAKAEIIRQGDKPSISCLLVSGICGRVNTLPDGGRQITQISLAGDFLDLHSLLLASMDHSVVALCDSEIIKVPHEALRRITETQPRLTRLMWMETVIDAAIHRQWIVSKGRRTGLGHMAHLFCETYLRLEAAGVAADHAFDFPIAQTDLADITGMSAVHANRLVQQLRSEQAIQWASSRFRILDWPRLAALAEFDPAYLRLTKDPV